MIERPIHLIVRSVKSVIARSLAACSSLCPPQHRSWIAAALILTALPPQLLLADQPRFRLNHGSADGTDSVGTIPDSFVAPIDLSITGASAGETLTLTLSSYRSDDPKRTATAIGFAPDLTRPASGGSVERTRTVELDQDQASVLLYLDASNVTVGEDQSVALEIISSSGDQKTLTTRLEWDKPRIFQIDADGNTLDAISISDSGRSLASIDLASFGQLDGAIDIMPDVFLQTGSGEEARLKLELPATGCAVADGDDDHGSLSLKLTSGSRCAEIPLVIDGGDLRPGKSYHGGIEIVHESGARHKTMYRVTRTVISRDAIPEVTGTTVGEETCVLGCKPKITLTLAEKTDDKPLRALTIKPVGTEPTKLASSTELSALLLTQHPDGLKAAETDLWNLDRDDGDDVALRSLKVGDQATLAFEPTNKLGPGEHKVEVQLQAENGDPNSQPTIELTFRVTQRLWVPLAVLISAVLLSYWISRGIGLNQRHRKLTEAVKKLRGRGAEKIFRSDSQPIVQLRAELSRILAALKESDKLYRFISVPEDLEKRLETAEKRFPALEQLVACEIYWATNPHNDWVTRRARKCIRGVVEAFGETATDSEFPSDVLETLAELRRWEDMGQLTERYWLHLKADIGQLKSIIVLHGYDGPDVDDLRKILKPVIEDYQKFEEAAAALGALRNEIGELAANGTDVSTLQKAIAVDLSSVQEFGAELEKAQDLLDHVASNGLVELETVTEAARDQLKGSPLRSFWQDIAATKQQLKSLKAAYPEKTETAVELVDKLPQHDADWLIGEIGKLAAAITKEKSTPREKIRESLARLDTDQTPANLAEAIGRERQYARLKLIWDYRDVKELDKPRVALINGQKDIEDFFIDVDNLSWRNLKNKLSITRPRKETTQEKLRLIEFEITPEEDEHGRNFLFKHGLSYSWKLNVDEGVGLKTLREVITREPRVVQYVPPGAERVEMAAKAFYEMPGSGRDESSVESVEFPTRMSDELKWRKSFQRGELIALGIAVLLAVVTGMQSDIFEATLMGSYQAYLALLVWGFASERAAKLLTDIDTYAGR